MNNSNKTEKKGRCIMKFWFFPIVLLIFACTGVQRNYEVYSMPPDPYEDAIRCCNTTTNCSGHERITDCALAAEHLAEIGNVDIALDYNLRVCGMIPENRVFDGHITKAAKLYRRIVKLSKDREKAIGNGEVMIEYCAKGNVQVCTDLEMAFEKLNVPNLTKELIVRACTEGCLYSSGQCTSEYVSFCRKARDMYGEEIDLQAIIARNEKIQAKEREEARQTALLEREHEKRMAEIEEQNRIQEEEKRRREDEEEREEREEQRQFEAENRAREARQSEEIFSAINQGFANANGPGSTQDALNNAMRNFRQAATPPESHSDHYSYVPPPSGSVANTSSQPSEKKTFEPESATGQGTTVFPVPAASPSPVPDNKDKSYHGVEIPSSNPPKVVSMPAGRNDTHSYHEGAMFNGCVRFFYNPKMYNWYSVENNCGEGIRVTFINPNGAMDIKPGRYGSPGYSKSEMDKYYSNISFAICRMGYIPINAEGKYWTGGPYRCKSM